MRYTSFRKPCCKLLFPDYLGDKTVPRIGIIHFLDLRIKVNTERIGNTFNQEVLVKRILSGIIFQDTNIPEPTPCCLLKCRIASAVRMRGVFDAPDQSFEYSGN